MQTNVVKKISCYNQRGQRGLAKSFDSKSGLKRQT